MRVAMEPRLDSRDRTSCYSNLGRIGSALAQYSQDSNDTFPRAWFGQDAGPSDATINYKWMDAIFPYAKDENLFNCPRDNINAPYHYRSADNYGSYVMNNAYFAPGDKQTPPAGSPLSKLEDGSDTLFITDGGSNFQVAWPDAAHTPPLIEGTSFQLSSIYGRHDSNYGTMEHGSALAMGCDGSCMTTLLGFETRTKLIGGQKIYPKLTIEDD